MARRAFSALSRASLVVSLAILALTWIEPARGAEACVAAPKSTAPQGSHWYYRLDRASQRKCWYLAAAGQKARSRPSRLRLPAVTTQRVVPAAAEPPAPRVVPRGGAESPKPAPVAQGPEADVSAPASIAERSTLTEPPPTSIGSRSDWLVTSAEAKENSTGVQPAAANRIKNRILPDEQPAQSAVTEAMPQHVTPRADVGLFQFGLIVLAALCLMAGAGFYPAEAKWRRGPGAILDLNTKAPLRRPDASVTPGLDTLDEAQSVIEERLRQFARTWKRQAA